MFSFYGLCHDVPLAAQQVAIGQTLVPSHMRREAFGAQSAYAAAVAAGVPPEHQQQQIRAPPSMGLQQQEGPGAHFLSCFAGHSPGH